MKNFLLTLLRYLSLPLAILYGLIIWLRNKGYDAGLFTSIGFSIPVISVGNLTVGGTGKTPHIEYLIRLLQREYAVATLSRGYKRRTRGFILANEQSRALDIGDEPRQYKIKYPDIEVCVAEERMMAIPQLLQKKPQIQVILLDDAFQHRSVKPEFNILLTDYGRLYTRDYILPFGLLREGRKAAGRADCLIVSKCPAALTQSQRQELIQELQPGLHQQVFFTTLVYDKLIAATSNSIAYSSDTSVLLISGIANPIPLEEHLKSVFSRVHLLRFPDHHFFTTDDLEEINQTFSSMDGTKMMITTEKDFTRLEMHTEAFSKYQWPLYIQAVQVRFLFDDEETFIASIKNCIHLTFPPLVPDHDSSEKDIVTDTSEDIHHG